MIRNQAGQAIGAQMINSTTGLPFAGVVTVYVTIDAGVQAIGSVSAGICTAEGNGYYTYLPALEETDGALLAFTFTGPGAVYRTVQVPTITEQQRSALQTSTGVLPITGRDLVTDALRELGILNASDPANGDDADFGLRKLNRLLDLWNSDRQCVYADAITTYTLTASLNPHTIGPDSATFTVAQRPQSLDAAHLVISGIRTPLRMRDAVWWLALPVPTLTAQRPTDLYYEPSWPNGSLYLYPVTSAANSLELLTRVVLGSLTLNDTFTLPPGYQDAVTLTLAEDLAAPFTVPLPRKLEQSAQLARARVFGNNLVIPKIQTRQLGVPGTKSGYFDWQTGRVM